MNIEEWFPTLIYNDVIDISGLEEIAYKLKKESDGRQLSNRGGWQSHGVEKNPLFSKLIDVIEQKALKVYNNMYEEDTGKYQVVGMWVNINKPNSYNATHMHPTCDLSGNIYIKTPKNCGITFFEDPRNLHRMAEPYNNIMQNRHTYRQVNYVPESVIILFFPPWIQHGVEQNLSDEDRISIAFNMMYVRKGCTLVET